MSCAFIKRNEHRIFSFYQNYSLCLFIIVASLLLGFTNAAAITNNNEKTANNETGLIGIVKNYANNIWNNLNQNSNGNLSTATNESSNETEPSPFHKPRNMSDLRQIGLIILRLLSQAFIIFGGVIPYIPQYLMIKRTQNAEGFSNYVCLTLLVANIIRIEFWFGKHFEMPLLLQSIVMIICMLIMLEIWTRFHARAMRLQVATDDQSISGSKEQLTDIVDKKFTDFDVDYFWRWTRYTSYLQFLFLLTLLLSILTWILIKNVVYIELIGFLAVFCEALLGVPQFLRNLRLKSTHGMSVKMVLLWLSGDLFKTVYFIIRNAPKQFWLCGMLQISIDVAILFQVMIYSKKCRISK